MSIYIQETDQGSKKRYVHVLREIQRKRSPEFKKFEQFVGDKVLKDAKRLCPVGTPTSTGIPNYIGGTLKSTVRKENKPIEGMAKGEIAVGSTTDPQCTIVILAGGIKVNPNTGRLCDYAQPVHDGTFKMPPRPFIRQAWEMNEAHVDKALSQYMERITKDWAGS